MIAESTPVDLRDYLGSSELQAAHAGKLRLWRAAYAHARRTLGVAAAVARANIVLGLDADLKRADENTTAHIRAELAARRNRLNQGQLA